MRARFWTPHCPLHLSPSSSIMLKAPPLMAAIDCCKPFCNLQNVFLNLKKRSDQLNQILNFKKKQTDLSQTSHTRTTQLEAFHQFYLLCQHPASYERQRPEPPPGALADPTTISSPPCQTMMRRTTLGPVTNNGLNVRMSMGGAPMRSIPGASALKQQPSRRASAVPTLGGGGTGRRSSQLRHGKRTASASLSFNQGTRSSMAFGNTGGTRRIKDPRPLNDRQYIHASVRNLIKFVVDRGYDHSISMKVMTNPTSRDFTNMFGFLMKSIDPSFEFRKRFEDEIPSLMKFLGYPFNISKSALSAVGSPHTWPSLLGVLTWLREYITYHDEEEMVKEKQLEMDVIARREVIFEQDLAETYTQFLLGDDEYPQLDEKLQGYFEDENMQMKDETERLTVENVELEKKLSELKSQPTPLEQIEEHAKALRSNIAKFNKLIPSLEAHRDSVSNTLEAKKKELNQIVEETTRITEEKVRLEEIVERQQQASINVELIAQDRSNLTEALQKVAMDRTSAEAQRCEAEQDVVDSTRNVNDALEKYHKDAEALELVPSNAKNANGVDFKIVLSRDADRTNAEDMLSLDVNKNVLPSIKELREGYEQRVQSLRKDELALQEKNFALEEQLIVERQRLNEVQLRHGKLEEDYKKTKQDLEDTLKDQAEKKAAHSESVSKLRKASEDAIRETSARRKALTQQLHETHLQIAGQKRSIAKKIAMSSRILREQHRVAHRKLLRAKAYIDNLTLETNREEDEQERDKLTQQI